MKNYNNIIPFRTTAQSKKAAQEPVRLDKTIALYEEANRLHLAPSDVVLVYTVNPKSSSLFAFDGTVLHYAVLPSADRNRHWSHPVITSTNPWSEPEGVYSCYDVIVADGVVDFAGHLLGWVGALQMVNNLLNFSNKHVLFDVSEENARVVDLTPVARRKYKDVRVLSDNSCRVYVCSDKVPIF